MTNIGFSHIERLGSREEILAAKTEICEGLGPGGILIIDGDDSLLTEFVRKPENKRWEYLGISSFEKDRCGESTRYIYPENVVTNGLETSFAAVLSRGDQTFCRVDIKLATTGRHHVKNALFSLLCADFFGVDLANVATALGQCRPMEGRGKIINTRHYTVFDDAYNAGPESMLAAFESVGIFAGDRRKIAAIGGMLELGNFAPELHRQVGISAAESGIDDLYACGEFAENIRQGALSLRPEMRVHIFENKETLLNDLLRALEPGDVILTKASHAFGFDWVAEEIIKYDGGPVMSDSYGDLSSSESEVGLC